MPMIDAGDGCLLNVSVEGRDGGPTLMLSNSLGCTLQMWEPQMAALTSQFRVVRYDRRGHGKSSVPPGPYSMQRFGRDVLEGEVLTITTAPYKSYLDGTLGRSILVWDNVL
jgi:3-oxoadipate enol-lactonase